MIIMSILKRNIERFFTIEEANDLIPYLEDLVYKILDIASEIKAQFEKGKSEYDYEIISKIDAINKLFAEIENKGCYYRDWTFKIGLVDFPTIIDNRLAYFCWKYGEKEIIYYHFSDEGFTQRKSLEKIKISRFN